MLVDGDTFWFKGIKIRIADFNAPEVSQPQCARERDLRRKELLEQGPFELVLAPDGQDKDCNGRKLRIMMRAGHSIGDTLIAEGLAHPLAGATGSVVLSVALIGVQPVSSLTPTPSTRSACTRPDRA